MNTRAKALLVLTLFSAANFSAIALNITPYVHGNPAAASVTPSKNWGIFVGTLGNLNFTINQTGIAVRIRMPRDFVMPAPFQWPENLTTFLSSTITNDYFYYVVKDESTIAPYDPEAPIRVEVHNPGYASFTPPQYIFMNELQAPGIAGTYNFTIYIATALTPAGEPDFPSTPTETVSIPVSMREDPSSITGYIREYSALGAPPIRAKGIVYATETTTGARARAYVNPNTGFFNITGLYTGSYELEASAGYCADTGYAYIMTKYPTTISLTRGQNLLNVNITLTRGCIINGTIFWKNPLKEHINPLDHPWLKKLNLNILNFTAEAYDSNGILRGSYTATSQNLPRENFVIYGSEYEGLRPDTYTVKVWAFGYTQGQVNPTSITFNFPGTRSTILIEQITGAVISGTIVFPETPRTTEYSMFGSSTGRFFGGNILAESLDAVGTLYGLTILDRTRPDGEVTYADSSSVRFYILGFSEFYNKTFSGVWRQKDHGLPAGIYDIKVWVRGYLQTSTSTVQVPEAGNTTVRINLEKGSGIRTEIASWVPYQDTGEPNYEAGWRFLPSVYYLRVYYYEVSTGTEVGYAEKKVQLGADVTPTRMNVIYSGNNWPVKQIIYQGLIPTTLAPASYSIKVFTYGYVQRREVIAWTSPGSAEYTYVPILRAGMINGTVTFKKDDAPTNLVEDMLTRVDTTSNFTGFLSGAQILSVPNGSPGFIYKVYGFTGGTRHFFYVAPDGTRLKDYGLENATYLVKVPESGVKWRFMQRADVYAYLTGLGLNYTADFDLHQMGVIEGMVRGYDTNMQLIPLSWVEVRSDSRWTPTMDGYYRLFLPPGSYLITFSEPGYLSQSWPRSVVGAAVQTLNVQLSQSGSRSLTVALNAIPTVFTGDRMSYILKATTIGETSNSTLTYLWSADGGSFNSTIGRVVIWTAPNKITRLTYIVTVTLLISGNETSRKSMVLRAVPIPEFPSALATLLSGLALTIATYIFRRRSPGGRG